MAKRIIVLDKTPEGVRAALWADVPVARQPFYARAGAVSTWAGASVAENDAIASGAVAEKVMLYSPAAGETLAQGRAILIAKWTSWQAFVTASNPWARYGSFYDGSTWTAGVVA